MLIPNPSATSVQIFNNPQFGEIRTAGTSEQLLFCLADLCRALGLSSKGVNQRLSDGVVSNYPIIDNLGRTQQALFVNEDGMYDVILDSRKPEAKIFRKWVTSEVLPAIRKTGAYSMNAAYPGTLTPSNCAVLTCHTADGQTKQAYLMYGDDTWFGCQKYNGERHNAMQRMTHEIADYDDDTVHYETHVFHLKDGKYVKCTYMFPPHDKHSDKHPKTGNAVANCQQAIERYRKAAEDVKTSAGAMIEYLGKQA